METPATRSFRLALVPLTAVLLLVAGCGGSETRAPLSSTRHNDADVAFATDMIQHHAQALAMVDLTVRRQLDPAIQALAEQVRDAQAPEVETMADWLNEWDEDIPETMNDHEHHDLGTMPEGTEDMPGMMSGAEMEDLENASDADFQALWLEMMIRHHRGAIEMARTEEQEGRFKPAVKLAKAIVRSQLAEVEEMERLSSGL